MPPLIGPRTPIAERHKRVKLSITGAPAPDGEGGFEIPDVPLDPPAVWALVRPASARDLEQMASGTVIAQATHIVEMPYHPGMTINATLLVEAYPKPDRRLTVVYIGNPDERDARLELICAEKLS
jgi:head-tail adaptor